MSFEDLPTWDPEVDRPGPWWGAGWVAWCEDWWRRTAPLPVKPSARRRYGRGRAPRGVPPRA